MELAFYKEEKDNEQEKHTIKGTLLGKKLMTILPGLAQWRERRPVD